MENTTSCICVLVKISHDSLALNRCILTDCDLDFANNCKYVQDHALREYDSSYSRLSVGYAFINFEDVRLS